MTCPHQYIATFLLEDTMQPVLWACKHCGHKFVPLDIGMEQDAARYRWLRDGKGNLPAVITDYGWCEELDFAIGAELDAAIDTARKE